MPVQVHFQCEIPEPDLIAFGRRLASYLPPPDAEYIPPHTAKSTKLSIPIPFVDAIVCIDRIQMDRFAMKQRFVIRDKDTGAVSRKCSESHLLFGFASLLDHLDIPLKGVASRSLCLVLCPDNIRQLVEVLRADAIFPGLDIMTLNDLVYRTIISHELGHFTLDPRLRLDDARIHEGFANLFAFDCLAEKEKRIIDWIALNQDLEYNYFYFMKYMDFGSVFQLLRGQMYDLATEEFYRNFTGSTLQEATDGVLRVRGNINGFGGFGARNCTLLCHGRIQILCNCSNCLVLSGHVDVLEGYVRKDVRIITNELGKAHCYDRLPRNVRVVAREEFDIAAFLAETNDVADVRSIAERLLATSNVS